MGAPWPIRRERLAEFAQIRKTRTKADGTPISVAEAAAAVGVHPRTGARYNAELVRAGVLTNPINQEGIR